MSCGWNDSREHIRGVTPPIEVEAARLRRMLQRREELLGSTSGATRTHLIALDSAIVDSASELADAVGVERPHRVPSVSLPEGELPALLAGSPMRASCSPHVTAFLTARAHS